MKTEEIIKGNILIALFMGYTERFDLRTDGKPKYQAPITGDATHSMAYSAEELEHSMELQFNKSWDWIMPVVDKIKELKHPIYLYQSHVQSTVEIFEMKNDHYIIRESDTISKPIEVLFRAVVQFIKFYNKEKK
jgi:hypothetical protein